MLAIDFQRDRQTEKDRDRETERHRDRETERDSERHRVRERPDAFEKFNLQADKDLVRRHERSFQRAAFA